MLESVENLISIVLVEPLFPMNIGAVCRAMKNFGLFDLRLVHPPLDRKNEAMKMAHGATEILENARKVFTLDEALDDVSYVIGATARLGGWRARASTPRVAAPEILRIAQTNRVAILFGAEDRGLANDAIARCQMLLTIPASRAHRSLNIAQAVLLVGYELFVADLPDVPAPPAYAPAAAVEAMFDDLADALDRIHFLRPGKSEYWMLAFKRLFGRTGLTPEEVNLMRGVCRQIRWVVSRREVPPSPAVLGQEEEREPELPMDSSALDAPPPDESDKSS
ncbi:MAG: RNA methyltransferase [Myxococcales bacterium]|nr:MAG: RNA methyltransferase [Myxococcales bacterium]